MDKTLTVSRKIDRLDNKFFQVQNLLKTFLEPNPEAFLNPLWVDDHSHLQSHSNEYTPDVPLDNPHQKGKIFY